MASYTRSEKFKIPYEKSGQMVLLDFEISGEEYNRNVHTPDLMIKMDDFLGSTVSGLEDYTRLLIYKYELSLETNPGVTENLRGSGSVKMGDLIVGIPNSKAIPELTMYLRTGKFIDQILIKDLTWAGGDKAEVQSIHGFGRCRLVSWYPGIQSSLFVIRPEEWIVNMKSKKQEDGGDEGNTTDQFNFRTASNTVGISL